jgi:TFIIF-interacting CTD phosphatase-like protein
MLVIDLCDDDMDDEPTDSTSKSCDMDDIEQPDGSPMHERKLLLVIDLDETLVHSNISKQFPRTNAMFSRRPQDEFILLENEIVAPGVQIFIRPGAVKALKYLSQVFVLGIFTFGVAAYASLVIGAIDPDGKLFGDRVYTREDVAETSPWKYIPSTWGCFDETNTIIIDDKPEVWNPEKQYSIIKVSQYRGGEDEIIHGNRLLHTLSMTLLFSYFNTECVHGQRSKNKVLCKFSKVAKELDYGTSISIARKVIVVRSRFF